MTVVDHLADMTSAVERLLDEAQPMPSAVVAGLARTHSPRWHELRSRGIGGSEVAAILGLSPWQSPFSLWHSKRHGWTTDAGDEARWGSAIEPALLQWWADEHPGWGWYGVRGSSYRHRSRTWQLASPDGVARSECGELVIVEAKKASDDDQWGTPGTDEVPPYYRTQVVWYMDVLGVPRAEFVVTNFGRAPAFYGVDYDPEEARLIRARAAAFWRSLRHDQAPDIDGHAATYQAVRRLHPDIDGTTVTIPDDVGRGWWAAKTGLAVAEHAAREATSALLAEMGTARRAVLADGTQVARRQPSRGGVSLYSLATKGI